LKPPSCPTLAPTTDPYWNLPDTVIDEQKKLSKMAETFLLDVCTVDALQGKKLE